MYSREVVSAVSTRHCLAAAAISITACGRVGFEDIDAGADTSSDVAVDAQPALTARVASQAYWTNWFGTTFGTPGMAMTGYSIATTADTGGLADGELLLLVACVDNGSDTVWPNPIAPGFTQIFQRRWGNDGQSCAIAYKIAANEPATYAGTYGPGIVSGSALIALLAIRGASSTTPVSDSTFVVDTGGGKNPVNATSPGVTTTVPGSLVLYATGSDWECFEVTDVTFSTPAGFTQLFASSDRGALPAKDWTTFQIATQTLAVPGSTGQITSTESSTGSSACLATPWTATLAITPDA